MLSVDGAAAPVKAAFTRESVALAHRTMREDGFLRVPDAVPRDVIDRLRRGMDTIREQGWPVSFVFLFEEPWLVLEAMRPLLASFLGEDYVRLAGFWAWFLPPGDGARGWRPHRDSTVPSVRADGSLDIMTLWIALADATPENGCMYFVPAPRDPAYRGDLSSMDVVDPASVRALPARAGTVLGWTQHLLHWGGRSSAWAEGPRVSLSMEFQRPDVPLRNGVISEVVPPFRERARWLGKQIEGYAHMEPPSDELAALARRLIEP